MKKLLWLSGCIAFAFMACEEHEIIPPPVPLVDLDCECEAMIGDSAVSYTDTCRYSSTKTISTTSLSKAQYQTQIQNSSLLQGIQIEMRSAEWTDDGSNNPSSTVWQAFFNDNMSPMYSTNIDDHGVVVTWTDPNNVEWVSDTGSICISNFTYNSFIHDSDTTGEYMKFDAVFNGVLKTSGYGTIDSTKCVENGYVKSAFRLE